MGRPGLVRRHRFRLVAPLAGLALGLPARLVTRVLDLVWPVGWRLVFALERRRRRRMHANLAEALGDRFATAGERERVVRESARQLYRSVLDASLAVLHPRVLERVTRFPVRGREHLDKALAQGRGALVVSAHLGAFTLVPIRLAALHPVSLLANHPDDARLAAFQDECLARVNVGSVPSRPRRAAAQGSLEALRQGRLVVIYADEFKAGGVPVEFLGHPASAPRGPATLALRTGAPLLPVFALRGAEDRLRLEIGPPIELVRGDDPVADVAANTARVCAVIEEQVRRLPEQWNWANFRLRPRRGSAKFRAGRRAGDASTPAPEEDRACR